MKIYEPEVVTRYGMTTYFDYEEALAISRKLKKPLMLDFTGINCVYLEHLLFKGTDTYGTLNWAKEKLYIDYITNLYEKYTTLTDPEERKKAYHEIDRLSGEASKYSIANEYDKLMSNLGSQGTNAHT